MKRYPQSLSRWKLCTGDMGGLYPIGLMEALPGDTVRHRINGIIRLSPMQAPVMHPVTIRIHTFFVPFRVIWTKWEEFITGGPQGDNNDVVPTMATTGVAGDMLDYLGIPKVSGIQVSKLPVWAVNACWNEYYRDQDLQTERAWDDVSIPRVAWEKDYFSVARPWTQKGPEITLPLGGQAPIKGLGSGGQTYSSGTFYETGGTAGRTTNLNATGQTFLEEDANNAGFPGAYADLSQATAASVNDVRRAFSLQRLQEARARYGSRYVEYLRYLGVSPRDSRLDRPEYLGGGKIRVAISEVLQTANEAVPSRYGVGDLYGHGVGAVRANGYRWFVPEHGYIVSFVSVRPRAVYSNGIHRTWLRQTKEDFFQRELQYIGQQAIMKNEIYADPTDGGNTWGYCDRYAEYRSCPSEVAGEFRQGQPLEHWHLARQFTEGPTLNSAFVECNPSKRIFNVQTNHTLWMAFQHRMVARRMVDRSAYGKII